ncbi:MAG: hypothetical protein LCH53_07820 [Bacteroidetes bacterium]|nr:hypothetical protein [Bacteroidota bacterium]
METRSTSDTLVQIAIVVGLILLASFVFKVAFGLIVLLLPFLAIVLAAYVAWRVVQAVQAKRG